MECEDHKDRLVSGCRVCDIIRIAKAQVGAAKDEAAAAKEIAKAQVGAAKDEAAAAKEEAAAAKEEAAAAKKRAHDAEVKLQEISRAPVLFPGCVFAFSVSASSKDKKKRGTFREMLPAEHYPGAFVVHDFFIEFVKAARRMSSDADEEPWPSRDQFDRAVENVAAMGNVLARSHHSLFPTESRVADLEEPQSALATELLRVAIEDLQVAHTPRIFLSHQFTVADMVNADDGSNCLLFLKNPVGNVKLEFKVDILAWVAHQDADGNTSCIPIAATEYKPDDKDEAARKAQADMYGVNLMSLNQRPCVAVDIQGGKDWKTWKVCASAIVPYPLGFSGRVRPPEQRYAKSALLEGHGAEGIVCLAAGLVMARKGISDEAGYFGQLMGPVVGFSKKRQKVTKAYDGAAYRRPNIEIVRRMVDKNATLWKSFDEQLVLVETAYVDSDWTKPVPVSVFAALLKNLGELHREHGPHGDIRLANLLRDRNHGYLTDFDFINTQAKYPRGLQDLDRDGARHPEVCDAIAGNCVHELLIKTEHDFFSMSAVMKLFEGEHDFWKECISLTEQGMLIEAEKKLMKNERVAVDLNAEVKGMLEFPGTGATPPRVRNRLRNTLLASIKEVDDVERGEEGKVDDERKTGIKEKRKNEGGEAFYDLLWSATRREDFHWK